MACRVLPFAAVGAVFLSLAGCGDYQRAQRPAWRTQAENACIASRLIQVSAYVQPAPPIDGPGICGLTQPFHVTALLDGEVTFNTRYTLDCPMIAALNDWLREVVEPAAQARFNSRVVEIIGMGTYSCRGINGMAGARLSEHAFGNAMDIGGFRLADGRVISIVRDWYHGDEASEAFLRDAHAGACSHFTTVLGPGYNIFHYNHFHVDLAMHGNTSTGPRRICRPTPQATPAPEHAPDGLPEAPPSDEDLDISQAGAANAQALALHGPGGNVDAAIPPPAPMASYRRTPAQGSSYPPQAADPVEEAYHPPQDRSVYPPTAARRDPAAPGSLYRPPGETASDDRQPVTTIAAERPAPMSGRAAYQGSSTSGADYERPMPTAAVERPARAVPGSLYQPPADIGVDRPPSGVAVDRRPVAPGSAYRAPAQSGNYDPAPQRGTMRADGAYVPEGRPGDWDLQQ